LTITCINLASATAGRPLPGTSAKTMAIFVSSSLKKS
jgi:hypothetical protein